jgi:hypothetical protein
MRFFIPHGIRIHDTASRAADRLTVATQHLLQSALPLISTKHKRCASQRGRNQLLPLQVMPCRLYSEKPRHTLHRKTRGLGPQQPLGTRGHDESEGGGVVI